MRSFKPSNKNVDQVLSQHLMVPLYQRPYTWRVDEITQLWEDLQFTNEESHFLGIVVLHNRRPDDNEMQMGASGALRLEVIDGQQRLITLSLLIALLRNLFTEIEATKEANGLHTLLESPSSRGPDEPKLMVSPKISTFFGEYIQGFTNPLKTHKKLLSMEISQLSAEVQNLVKNYRRFFEKIAGDARYKKNTHDFLVLLREQILNAEVIEVTVNSEDDAFDLFETLNSRLVRLSEVDMIKNRLFMKLNRVMSEEDLDRSWDEIRFNAAGARDMPSDVQKFINYSWWSRERKVPPKQIFRTLKQRDANKTLTAFVDDSRLYSSIVSTDSSKKLQPKGVNLDNLRVLGQLMNLRQINIPLLAIIRKVSLNEYKTDFHNNTINRLIEDLERFIIAYKFSPRSPSAIENVYADNAKKIFESKNRTQFNQAILDFQKQLNSNFPTSDEFYQSITELRYRLTDSKNNRLISYLFEKIYVGDKSEIKFDDTNLDHIFPQSPEGGPQEEGEESLLSTQLHEIGNLTVLGADLNRECGNKRPKDKVDIYKKSLIPANQEITEQVQKSGWVIEDVQNRTLGLQKKIWTYLSSN